MMTYEDTIRVEALSDAVRRVGSGFLELYDAIARGMGYPSREDLAHQRRIERHMTRCAMRRRRRKGRR